MSHASRIFTYTKTYVSLWAAKRKSRIPRNDILIRKSFLKLNQ